MDDNQPLATTPDPTTIRLEAQPRRRPGRLRRILASAGRLLTAPIRPRHVHRAPVPEPRPTTGAGASGDRLIRAVAITVLLGVGAGAGYVSYHHFYGLALALGERHDMAVLYPAMSDGVIVMASLVMVYCSRRGIPVPVLAWAALALGGVVTLVANVAHGWSGGAGTRLLSALAPVAFVGAYELLMWLVRTGRRVAEPPAERVVEKVVYRDREVPVEVVRVERVLPRDRYEAAAWEFEDSLATGARRAGRRTLASHWGITEREAEQIQNEVRAERTAEQPQGATPEEPAAPREPEPDEPGDERDEEVSPDLRQRISRMRAEALMDRDAIAAVNGQSAAGGA